MTNVLWRLLGALVAVAMIATACGGSTASNTASEARDDTAINDEPDKSGDHDEHGDSHDDDSHDDDSHDDDKHDDDKHGGHGAATLDVNPDAAIPEVAIELTETEMPGVFDLVVSLTNFTITPDNIDGDPIDNEGHMHLLIDGEKIARFTELESQVTVPEGEHLVEVELNANNHAAYAIDGTAIRAGQTVSGHGTPVDDSTASADGHDHSHGEASDGVEEGLAMGDATVTLAASFVEGSVQLDGDERLEVAIGDVVMITVESDVVEQAHLHGYDVLVDVTPGEAAMLLFTADTAGKFELEFETSGAFIAELVVS